MQQDRVNMNKIREHYTKALKHAMSAYRLECMKISVDGKCMGKSAGKMRRKQKSILEVYDSTSAQSQGTAMNTTLLNNLP